MDSLEAKSLELLTDLELFRSLEIASVRCYFDSYSKSLPWEQLDRIVAGRRLTMWCDNESSSCLTGQFVEFVESVECAMCSASLHYT